MIARMLERDSTPGARTIARARLVVVGAALAIGCGTPSSPSDPEPASTTNPVPTSTTASTDEGTAPTSTETTTGDGQDTTAPGTDETGAPPPPVMGTNPVLGLDHPDPGVLRIEDQGEVLYVMSTTVHNGGDFPLLTSSDLVSWSPAPTGVFDRPRVPGDSYALGDAHYCSLWAPEIAQLGPESFMLSFTAQRFATPRSPCPPYAEDSGVYLAWSSSALGPFAPERNPWEPLPAGGQISRCPPAVRDAIPHSLLEASDDCQGTFCHHIIRLDSSVFADPTTGRWWLAYAWYTNSPPQVAWELDNHGEHVHLVELDPGDPFAVICDVEVPQIHVANPHDAQTLAALASSCEGCDQMLAMNKGRFGEDMMRDGVSWGVAEAPSLFRRGDWVYLMLSGSAWDSAWYHVWWVAAPSVEQLALGDPARIMGRFLVPSDGHSFGHGTPVLGPDGESWFYVHHHLDQAPCAEAGQCARDVWVSPIEFVDVGDGHGAVHIAPRWPARDPTFEVPLPPG